MNVGTYCLWFTSRLRRFGRSRAMAHICIAAAAGVGRGGIQAKCNPRPGAVRAGAGTDPVAEVERGACRCSLTQPQFMKRLRCLVDQCPPPDEWADRIGALSLDAFDGRIEPFTRST